MRPTKPTDLGRELVRFFEDYLPAQRGVSPHTLRSYRDALLWTATIILAGRRQLSWPVL